MKTINCNNNTLKGVRSYKIKNDNATNHEIHIVEACCNTDLKAEDCKKCFGKIVISVREFINLKGNIEQEKIVYRDRFIVKNKIIKEIYEATEFLEKINTDILYEVTEYAKNQKVTMPWRAYDRPQNYKTACIDCKAKRHKLGQKAMCEGDNPTFVEEYGETFNNFCNLQKQTLYKIY